MTTYKHLQTYGSNAYRASTDYPITGGVGLLMMALGSQSCTWLFYAVSAAVCLYSGYQLVAPAKSSAHPAHSRSNYITMMLCSGGFLVGYRYIKQVVLYVILALVVLHVLANIHRQCTRSSAPKRMKYGFGPSTGKSFDAQKSSGFVGK